MSIFWPMGLLPDTLNCGLRLIRECRERFPRHQLQRKPLLSDPGMHHGTCVTHVPWCMSGSLSHGGGENVPGMRNLQCYVSGKRPVDIFWWVQMQHYTSAHQNESKEFNLEWKFLVNFISSESTKGLQCFSVLKVKETIFWSMGRLRLPTGQFTVPFHSYRPNPFKYNWYEKNLPGVYWVSAFTRDGGEDGWW